MFRKIAVIVVAAVVVLACQSGKEKELLQKLSEKYIFIKDKYEKKLKSLNPGDRYSQVRAIRKQRTAEYEALLKKFDKMVSNDDAELLKSKLLMEISRLDQAEQTVDRLSAEESGLIYEAKMAKVQILIYRQKPDEALKIFKTIEEKITPGLDLLSVYLYFALYSRDSKVVEEYGNKFLNSTETPRELGIYKAAVYRNLSRAAVKRNNPGKAQKMLEKGISAAGDRETRSAMESQLAQLLLMGNQAPAISAETWLNSAPLKLEQLKGKVVVIDFWAPWCSPCRRVFPGLVSLHEKYKDKGLVIIGLTKLYGDYSDDTGNKGIVSKREEISLIKAFVQRHHISYAAAIADERTNSETYNVRALPTMVFINKKGKVVTIHVGAGKEKLITNQIKELLTEKVF